MIRLIPCLFLVALGAASGFAQASDCDKWNLRGARVGMTWEEVLHATELHFELGHDGEHIQASFEITRQIKFNIQFNDEKKAQILAVSYWGDAADEDILLEALKDQWGRPAMAESVQKISDTLGKVWAWESTECDVTAVMLSWTEVSSGFGLGPFETDHVRIGLQSTQEVNRKRERETEEAREKLFGKKD